MKYFNIYKIDIPELSCGNIQYQAVVDKTNSKSIVSVIID